VAIKLRIPHGKSSKGNKRGFRDPVLRFALTVFACGALIFVGFFSYFYVKYDRIIEQRFRGPVFANSARIFAAPTTVSVGEKAELQTIAAALRHAGYTDKTGVSSMGGYHLAGSSIEIEPGPSSYHSPEPATIRVREGRIESISGNGGAQLEAYELEPQMITSFSEGEQRAKREVVKYNEIPKVLVDAVLAIEDRRFFEHNGINFVRFVEGAWVDVTRQRYQQGGSTLTMQLSRGFFLTPQRTIKRKLTEMLIAIELEQKFSKQQIFEIYANWVPLGQRGSFASAALPRPRAPISGKM